MALLCTSNAIADSTAQIYIKQALTQKIYQDPIWLNLLHYNDGKSLIVDTNYFVADDGGVNPQAELTKTIQYMFTNKNNFRCKFPARIYYLTKKLPNLAKQLSPVKCSKLNKYKRSLSANEVSLVFATEKVNSTLSMMGHIFIKVKGKAKQGKTPPQHSIGFFANFSKFNGVLSFATNALISGVDGLYIVEPYGKRKNIYLYDEDRSLMEYRLDLTQAEVDFLILHIWEMKNINVAYNIRNHNCASALVTLLQVIDNKYKNISYKDYMTPSDLINESIALGAVKKQPNKYIMLRSIDSNKKPTIKKNNSANLSVLIGALDNKPYVDLNYAVAYHNLMDDSLKFNKEFEVRLFEFNVRYLAQAKQIKLDNLIVYKTRSFMPTTINDIEWSEYFELSLQTENTDSKSVDLMPVVAIGRGITFKTFSNKFIPYVFLSTSYSVMNQRDNISIIPEIGFFLYVAEKNKFKISHKYYVNTLKYNYDNKTDFQYSYFINNNITAKAQYTVFNDTDKIKHNKIEGGLQFNF